MNIINVDIKPYLCDYQLDLASENPRFTGFDYEDVQTVFGLEIAGIWDHYQHYLEPKARNFTFEDFKILLRDFFALTLDSAISGYSVRRDGAIWKYRLAPQHYFAKKYNLSKMTFRSFFRAVEWNGPYTAVKNHTTWGI